MRIISVQEDIMDENTSLAHQTNGGSGNGGQLIGSGGVNQMGGQSGNKDEQNPQNSAQYTIPGILHYIQHEWARFELERSQWDVDRAELQVSIRRSCFSFFYIEYSDESRTIFSVCCRVE